jgi:hypothetical protein
MINIPRRISHVRFSLGVTTRLHPHPHPHLLHHPQWKPPFPRLSEVVWGCTNILRRVWDCLRLAGDMIANNSLVLDCARLFHSELRCNSLNDESKPHLYILQLVPTCCKQYQFTPDSGLRTGQEAVPNFTPAASTRHIYNLSFCN